MASLQDAWAAPAACKLRTRIIPSCTMKKKRREFPMLENCGRPPFQKGQRAVTPYICCAGRRNMILCLIWAISLRGKEQRERSLLPSLRPGAGAVHGRAINIYIYFNTQQFPAQSSSDRSSSQANPASLSGRGETFLGVRARA
jgi:hypothetical protein